MGLFGLSKSQKMNAFIRGRTDAGAAMSAPSGYSVPCPFSDENMKMWWGAGWEWEMSPVTRHTLTPSKDSNYWG